MADGKKKRKTKMQKHEYLKNKESFLDEIKTFFIVFEGLSFGENKKLKIIASSFYLKSY